VPPAEAELLRPLLAGGASSEVRVVAGAASFASDPEKLSYAIRDWAWRHAQPDDALSSAGAPAGAGGRSPAAGAPPDGYVCGTCQAQGRHYRSDCPLAAPATPPLEPQPSGFNIFVESLAESVNEIHRDETQTLNLSLSLALALARALTPNPDPNPNPNQVNEIHRDVQSNLPSMDAGGDSDNDDSDSDGEAEVPLLHPHCTLTTPLPPPLPHSLLLAYATPFTTHHPQPLSSLLGAHPHATRRADRRRRA